MKVLARFSNERPASSAPEERGRHSELTAECVAEVAMVRVPEIEGQARQVSLTFGESLQSRPEATAVEITTHRQPGFAMEDAGEMEGRAPQSVGQVAQRRWMLDVLINEELGGLHQGPMAPCGFDDTPIPLASKELVGTRHQIIDQVKDLILDGQGGRLGASQSGQEGVVQQKRPRSTQRPGEGERRIFTLGVHGCIAPDNVQEV